MTMGGIHNHIPRRPSEEFIGVLLGVRIKPMEVLVSVAIAAPLMIMVSGSIYPCIKIVGWLVFIPAVGIAMAVIVPVFGTVVNDLIPFVSLAIFLHDTL